MKKIPLIMEEFKYKFLTRSLHFEQKNFFCPLNQIERVSVSTSKFFAPNFELNISGSKSFTNRAVVLAGMSREKTKISGFLFSEDTYWGLCALQNLGFSILCDFDQKTVLVDPKALLSEEVQHPNTPNPIFLGKAGTLARFFPAVVLNLKKTFPHCNWNTLQLHAHEQLQTRPIAPLFSSLKELHANINDSGWPIQIAPSHLSGKTTINGNVSGQFLSGLLLAAAGSKNKIEISRKNNLVQPDYVKMTLKSLQKFNCSVEHDPDLTQFYIHQKEDLKCDHFQIEPDASTSCYFISLAFLHNFNLIIHNLGSESLQPDVFFIDFLKKMGASIEIEKNKIRVLKRESTHIHGGFSADFSKYSDQALTAAIVSLFADSPIEITGAAHIRNHECDRISSLVSNFSSLGLDIKEKEDGFTVFPLKKRDALFGKKWHTFDDHRFVMSGFLLASQCENLWIENPKCVEKTSPDFFEYAQKLGFEILKK